MIVNAREIGKQRYDDDRRLNVAVVITRCVARWTLLKRTSTTQYNEELQCSDQATNAKAINDVVRVAYVVVQLLRGFQLRTSLIEASCGFVAAVEHELFCRKR